MELDFAIIAEPAEATHAGPIHLWGAAFESVGATAFPATYQFTIVVKMRVTKDEVNRSHSIRLEVTDPTGETNEVMSNPDAKLREPSNWELPIYATFVFGLVFTFLNPGGYTFRFFADNAEVKSWPIAVTQLEGVMIDNPSADASQPIGVGNSPSGAQAAVVADDDALWDEIARITPSNETLLAYARSRRSPPQ